MKLSHCRFRYLAASLAAAFYALSGNGALAQAVKSIQVIVAVSGGSPGDIMTHLFTEQMEEAFSRTHGPRIVFEPRRAADGTLGTEDVSRAPPDGNTLLLTTNAFVINPYLRAVRYDPLTDFEPVCYLVSSPEIVAVKNTSPYHTLAELLGAARAKPGELTMASFGPSGSSHIAVEMLKLAAKVDLHYVPFPSQVAAVNSLLGDHVTSAIISYRGESDRVKAGTLRPLATASETRIEALPDVPTIAQSGYKDYDMEVRLWLFAPAKTPKEKVSEIARSFTAAMEDPTVKSRLIAQSLYPVAMCGADFAAYVRKRYVDVGQVIHDAQIR